MSYAVLVFVAVTHSIIVVVGKYCCYGVDGIAFAVLSILAFTFGCVVKVYKGELFAVGNCVVYFVDDVQYIFVCVFRRVEPNVSFEQSCTVRAAELGYLVK